MAAANPAAPGPDSGATDTYFPSWMILDDEAYLEDHDNATTAVGETSLGLRVKVTFLAADPPRLSRFCVHCPRQNNESDLHLQFQGRPRILQAAGDLALITIAHGHGYKPEYFFYRAEAAGPGRRPSIQPLPEIDSYLQGRIVAFVGFLNCGGGGGYVLAAYVFSRGNDRELHVFRSERGTWTTSVLEHGRHSLPKVEKVIAMGDGKLGFVDLLKGILVCDVLADKPTGGFIPLPKLLPGNKPDDIEGELCHARPFRDVAVYADGMIKCVEEEPVARLTIHKVPRVTKRRVVPEMLPDDVSNTDEIHDSDLMPDPVDVEEVDMEEEETYQYLGWRVIAWSRTPSSTCWRKECLIHVDDIVANHNPTHDALLDELGAPSLTLKDLRVSNPSLSTDDSNAVYLTTKKAVKESRDQEEMCVIKVDMGKKALEEISPVVTERKRYNLNYISCSLSKYWNMGSGN
ncbi:unnamed protein product [Urochloa humidicola]